MLSVMNRTQGTIVRVVSFGLGLVFLQATSGNALAQSEAPPAAAPAKIDPKARERMEQMAAAYRSLKSFSCEIHERETSPPNPSEKRITVAFKRPAQAVVAAESSGKRWRAVSDGKNLYYRYPEDGDKRQYRKWPLKSGERPSMYLVLARVLRKDLADLLAGGGGQTDPPPPSLKSLALGPPDEVAGVPVDTVVIVYADPDSPDSPEVTWTYAVGRKDHLLRRLTMSGTVNGQLATYTETHSQIRINPELPDPLFKFTPPPGAKEVLFPPPPTGPKKRAAPAKK